MLLKNIKFPVYSIGGHSKIWSENNVLFLESESGIIYKMDNKNLPFDTLGKRRLRISKKERYRFTGTYFTIAQLVKSNKKLFIDNEGKLINYKKNRRVNLIYREIIKKKLVEGKGILLYVKGISVPFLVSNFIYNGEAYLGLLNISDGYLIYELSEERKPDSWRKI